MPNLRCSSASWSFGGSGHPKFREDFDGRIEGEFARSRFEICDRCLPDDGKALILRPAIQSKRIGSAKYVLRLPPAGGMRKGEIKQAFLWPEWC